MALIKEWGDDPESRRLMCQHHGWHKDPKMEECTNLYHRKYDETMVNSGKEFLDFHRKFMQEFATWNNKLRLNNPTAGANPADITAWTGIPAVFKQKPDWVNQPSLSEAEARIESDMPPFHSEDEFGVFVEGRIHRWLHQAIAWAIRNNLLPGDPADPAKGTSSEADIIESFHSPQSTYFYQLHGMIEYWRKQWRWIRGEWKFGVGSLGEYLFKRRIRWRDVGPPVGGHANGVLLNGRFINFPAGNSAVDMLNSLAIFEIAGGMQSNKLGALFRREAMLSVIELAHAEIDKVKQIVVG